MLHLRLHNSELFPTFIYWILVLTGISIMSLARRLGKNQCTFFFTNYFGYFISVEIHKKEAQIPCRRFWYFIFLFLLTLGKRTAFQGLRAPLEHPSPVSLITTTLRLEGVILDAAKTGRLHMEKVILGRKTHHQPFEQSKFRCANIEVSTTEFQNEPPEK